MTISQPRPAPLTPADSDLSDFGFMPLEVGRFRRSDLVTQEEPEVIVAAILLWGAAWHSKPAASLSNDDRSLAQAAGFGRAVEAWKAVREGALRGFIHCSDGRLYHPVVAEKAREAWEAKLKRLWRTECARIRKANERGREKGIEEEVSPSFEDFIAARYADTSHATSENVTRDNLPQSRATSGDSHARHDEDGERVTRDNSHVDGLVLAQNDANGVKSAMSHATGTEKQRDIDLDSCARAEKGQGQGQGDSIDEVKTSSSTADDENSFSFPTDLLGKCELVARKAGLNLTSPKTMIATTETMRSWLDDGIDFVATIVPTIETRTASNPTEPIYSLRYFDAAVRKAHALTLSSAPVKARKPAPPKAPIALEDGPEEAIAKFRARLAFAVGDDRYSAKYAAEHVAMRIVDGAFLEMIFRSAAEERVANVDNQLIETTASRLGLMLQTRSL